jgi:signal transduction histidine kinase
MSASRARVVAWSMTISAVFFLATSMVIAIYDEDAFKSAEAIFAVTVLPFSLIGGFVASRRPGNPIGWIMVTAGVAVGLSGAADTYARYTLLHDPGVLPAGSAIAWVSNMTGAAFFFAALIYTIQLFPTGRPLNQRWRLLLKATTIAMGVLLFGLAFAPGPMEDLPSAENPLGLSGPWGQAAEALSGIGWLMATVCLLLSLAAVGLRWRRSRGDERQQMKWFGVAGLVLLVFMVIATVTEEWGLLTVPLAAIPVAVGIAILKYRLYDIDVVINKTIVFGALAAFITGIYVAIVVGIGTLLGSQDEPNLALSIAATAIVAIAFSPVKERTQRLANRLVYGQRLSPYEILSGLSRKVATAPSPESVLSGVASAAGQGVNAEAAAVTLHLHNGKDVQATYRRAESVEPKEMDERFDVRHEGETLGNIGLRKRAADPLTPNDRRLLEDLSAQAGLALHNARLAFELQARLDEISAQADELQSSRARIVSAADDSRRRLENDITEGPRGQLVTMQEALGEAGKTMEKNPEAAAAQLESLTEQANTTLDALRELARGIYPPLLADRGIVAALEAHIRKRDLPVGVDVDEVTRNARFDESLETTVYFCCVEALSDAGVGTIGVTCLDDELRVHLDGTEIDAERQRNITDRIEALNGFFERVDGGAVFCLPASGSTGSQAEASVHASSSSSGPN